MSDFWQIALSVAGLGAIGAFVFWSLMRYMVPRTQGHALNQKQTFILTIVSMSIVLAGLVAILLTYYLTHERPKPPNASDFAEKSAWELAANLKERHEYIHTRLHARLDSLVAEKKSGLSGPVASEDDAEIAKLKSIIDEFDRLSVQVQTALQDRNFTLYHDLYKRIVLLLDSPEARSVMHDGGVNVAFADGSVKFLKDSVSAEVWKKFGNSSENKTINPDDFWNENRFEWHRPTVKATAHARQANCELSPSHRPLPSCLAAASSPAIRLASIRFAPGCSVSVRSH